MYGIYPVLALKDVSLSKETDQNMTKHKILGGCAVTLIVGAAAPMGAARLRISAFPTSEK